MIKDVKDEERRDRELAIYSQELGVPLDWFAAKRKEKLAEAKKKHREEMLEKKRSVSRATGLSKLLEGDEEDEDGTASESDVSFTSGSSYSYSVDDSDADLTDRDEDEDGEDKVDEDDDDKWRPPSRDAEAAFHDSRSQASSKMSGSYSLRHNPAREAEEMETELEMVGRRKKSVYPSPKSTSGLSTGKAK